MSEKNKYVGNHYTSRSGYEYEVTNYVSGSEVYYRFLNCDFEQKASINAVTNGKVKYPFEKSCIYFDSPQLEFVGNTYRTNQGYLIKIVEYINNKEVSVQFLNNGCIVKTTLQNIRKGEVRNPFELNKFGGFMGSNDYIGKDYIWLYNIWYHLGINLQKDNTKLSSYYNASFCNEWLNYTNFANWYLSNMLNQNIKYEINISILNNSGNIIYSPQTCLLLPMDLNNMILFNHDKSKINSLALYYYKNNSITEKAYMSIIGR